MLPQSRHIRHLVVASHNGADTNSRDNCGRAPLHGVSHGGQLVIPVVSRLRGSSRGELISTHQRTPTNQRQYGVTLDWDGARLHGL